MFGFKDSSPQVDTSISIDPSIPTVCYLHTNLGMVRFIFGIFVINLLGSAATFLPGNAITARSTLGCSLGSTSTGCTTTTLAPWSGACRGAIRTVVFV